MTATRRRSPTRRTSTRSSSRRTTSSGGAAAGAIDELVATAAASDTFIGPAEVTYSDDGTVASVRLPSRGNGTDETSMAALDEVRDELVPATFGSVAGVDANVTGGAAQSEDFNDLLASRLPLVFVFVLGLAFLLMLVTFRSIVIPIKAIVLNLLSVGAAYGVLVMVFQWGWGESLLGFESNGGVTNWLPAVPVRDPVRALDGLPRVHPDPGPRAL